MSSETAPFAPARVGPEAARIAPEAARVAAYAFTQLEPPTVADIGDALAAAQREAEAIREQARAEGYAAGLADARQEAAGSLSALAAAADELFALREEVIAEAEQDALTIVFELAERVVAGVIDVEPERVLDVARHALRHLADRRHVTLIVNPDDLALLTDSVPELQASLGGIEHLAIQSDRRVGRGGAVARTEAGEIDVGIAAQLGRARELVADALSERLPEAAALAAGLGADEAGEGADAS